MMNLSAPAPSSFVPSKHPGFGFVPQLWTDEECISLWCVASQDSVHQSHCVRRVTYVDIYLGKGTLQIGREKIRYGTGDHYMILPQQPFLFYEVGDETFFAVRRRRFV